MNVALSHRTEGLATEPVRGAARAVTLSAVAAVSSVTTAITNSDATKRIRVVGYCLSTGTAGAISFRDSAGSPVTYFITYQAANATGAIELLPAGQFVLPAGLNLVLHHGGSATGTFTGTIFYNLEPI